MVIDAEVTFGEELYHIYHYNPDHVEQPFLLV